MAPFVLTEDLSRVQGFIAGCVEASTLMATAAVTGKRYSTDYLTQTIQSAIGAGVANPHGTGVAGLHWVLQHEGVSQYQDMPPAQWQSVLQQANGRYPVLLGVDHAGNGFPQDQGVSGHEVVVFGPGAQSGTWIVGDPNTSESQQGQTVTYTTAQIAAANPTTLTAVYGQGGYVNQPLAYSSPYAQPAGAPSLNPLSALGNTLGWLSQPIRLGKLLLGGLLLLGALGLFIASAALGSPAGQAALRVGAPVAGNVIAAEINRKGAQRATVREDQQRQQAQAQVSSGEQEQAQLAEAWYQPRQIEAGHTREPTAPLGTLGRQGGGALRGTPRNAPTTEQQQAEAQRTYRGWGWIGKVAAPLRPQRQPQTRQYHRAGPQTREGLQEIARRNLNPRPEEEHAVPLEHLYRVEAEQRAKAAEQVAGRPAGQTPEQIARNQADLTREARRIGRTPQERGRYPQMRQPKRKDQGK